MKFGEALEAVKEGKLIARSGLLEFSMILVCWHNLEMVIL